MCVSAWKRELLNFWIGFAGWHAAGISPASGAQPNPMGRATAHFTPSGGKYQVYPIVYGPAKTTRDSHFSPRPVQPVSPGNFLGDNAYPGHSVCATIGNVHLRFFRRRAAVGRT